MDIAIYQGFNFRAEDGAQTRDPQLGRLMLYQLSYSRNFLCHDCLSRPSLYNKVVSGINRRHRFPGIVMSCLVGEDGFEPPKSRDSRFTVCPIWPLWNSPPWSR